MDPRYQLVQPPHPDAGMVIYQKVVRDRIPEIIEEEGRRSVWRTATDAEYRDALREKLLEELGEYEDSGEVKELADIQEVVLALAALLGTTRAQLESLRLPTLDVADHRAALRAAVTYFLRAGDVEMLAAILDLTGALAEQQGVTRAELEALRVERAVARGAYERRIFLERADPPGPGANV